MRSYLIVGGNTEERIKKFEELTGKCLALFEKSPDFYKISPQERASISIEQVREIQKRILLKPFQEKSSIIFVPEAQKMTIDAQNSFLKTLEEPPQYCQIYLSCPGSLWLLPTISSRCQIITLNSKEINFSENEKKQLSEFLKKILESSPGEKLNLLEKDIPKETGESLRENAVNWLEKLQYLVREKLVAGYLDKPTPAGTGINKIKLLEILKLINQYRQYLEANCNVRLALENFVLEI